MRKAQITNRLVHLFLAGMITACFYLVCLSSVPLSVLHKLSIKLYIIQVIGLVLQRSKNWLFRHRRTLVKLYSASSTG